MRLGLVREQASAFDLPKYVLRRCCERNDGCLIWCGSINRAKGAMLPVFVLLGVEERLPRNVLWRASGRILRTGWVFCKPDCDPLCIEPAHQKYRSRALTLRDRNKAGLMHTAAQAAGCARARRARSDITMEIVMRMRERYAETGCARVVATEFNIAPSRAQRICTNQYWRVPTPFSGLAR